MNCTQSALASAVMAGGIITFSCGPGPITIPITSYMQIAGTVVIDGGGQITLDGGGHSSFFQIFSTATLTLANLTLANGNDAGVGVHPIENFGTLVVNNSVIRGNQSVTAGAGINNAGSLSITASTIQGNIAAQQGAGIYSTAGSVTMSGSTILSNAVLAHGPGGAGGIHIDGGSLLLNDSTVEANAGFDGGGIFTARGTTATLNNVTLDMNTAAYGAGSEIQGSLTATNSTFSGNTSGQDGGGLWVLFGAVTLNSVTISGNTAQNGGAINTNGGTATLKNTILDGSINTTNCNVGVTLTSNGHNLSTDASCPLLGPGDRTGIPALLGPLGSNGGLTKTQALLPGSPAIDIADNNGCPPIDERGVARPIDGNHDQIAVCDIGAYEYAPLVYVPFVQR